MSQVKRNPNTHIVAVDESIGAEEAFKHANQSLPKKDDFIVVHGRHSAPFHQEKDVKEDFARSQHIVHKYAQMCRESNRKCTFVDISFKTLGDLSNKICNISLENDAKSVIVGYRNLNTLDRTLVGSVSHSILHGCPCNITIVKNDKIDWSKKPVGREIEEATFVGNMIVE